MNRLLNRYCRALEAVCALLMAAMVFLVFGNVVLRYFFSTGLLLSEELSRWMFVWMVFMGAVVVMRERGHMGTDMVVVRLPAWAQRLCLVVAQIVMLYITWLMLDGSWSQVVVNRETEAAVSGLSVGIFYFAGVLFALSTAVILLHQLWLAVSGQLSDQELVMVQESEEMAHLVLPPEGDDPAPGTSRSQR
jgi:TRAP-type C4-dicarboxylate transport system permease small subunit